MNRLYTGHVLHKRLRPFRHRFVYRVFSLLLDLDNLPTQLRCFAHNRFGLMSLYDKDHGARDGSPLRPWVEQHLRAGGYDPAGWRILLACYPRLWGYVFNPLSVYYCYNTAGALSVILYEVKNTFGDQHGYLLKADDTKGCAKAFYVSPFIDPQAHYKFKFTAPGAELLQHIQESDANGPLLIATYQAQGKPLTDRAAVWAILTHPLMTLKVFAAIHWEALRLWLKGAKFHRRYEPPAESVSYKTHN
jgi:DUF1365 family protein